MGMTDPTVGEGPGPNTRSFYHWDDCARIMKDFGPRLADGTMKRENELGMTFLNDAPFPEGPKKIALGWSREDHAAVRPYLGKTLDGARMAENVVCDGSNGWNRQWLRRVMRQRLSESDELNTLDLTKFFSVILHKVHLNVEVTEEQTEEFTGMGMTGLTYGQIPPKVLACPGLRAILGINGYCERRQEYVDGFKDALRAKWPGIDENTLMLLANATCDSLLFAGGLSVPSVCCTMLALMYKEDPPKHWTTLNGATSCT